MEQELSQEGETINKGFIASIFEDKRIGNCSNDGISKWFDEVTIVSTIKEVQIFDIDAKSELTRPCIVIKKKVVGGEEYIYAEPLDDPSSSNVGWMMGGSYVHTCDSRFARHFSKYPIPLHDQQETPELNDQLSR